MNAIDLLDPHARRAILDLLRQMSDTGVGPGPEERAALRGAELALGLPGALSGPDAQPYPGGVTLERLSERDRMLAFVACAWLMYADAVGERREARFLDWLAAELHIVPPTARFLVAHARWIRTDHEQAPHREFDLLLSECARRVRAVETRAAA